MMNERQLKQYESMKNLITDYKKAGVKDMLNMSQANAQGYILGLAFADAITSNELGDLSRELQKLAFDVVIK